MSFFDRLLPLSVCRLSNLHLENSRRQPFNAVMMKPWAESLSCPFLFGLLGLKSRYPVQMKEKSCEYCIGHIFPSIWILVRLCFLMNSRISLYMDHLGKKPSEYCMGHIFHPVTMEIGQNVLFNNFWAFLWMGHLISGDELGHND